MEQVVGSGSTFNFCLDFGNDGTCDYTANSQAFTGPVRLDTTNLATALNAYVTAQGSNAPVLTIPIRVNISTPADIFLFNLSATPLTGIDLQPSALVIAPQNGNPASNIPEGTLVDLSTSITNNGTTNVANFTVAFYLGDPGNGGTLIGSKFIESLAAGTTSPTQTVVWNTSGLLGAKTIYVKVDPSNAVGESNETNNAASASSVIKKKPDLTFISLRDGYQAFTEQMHALRESEPHALPPLSRVLEALFGCHLATFRPSVVLRHRNTLSRPGGPEVSEERRRPESMTRRDLHVSTQENRELGSWVGRNHGECSQGQIPLTLPLRLHRQAGVHRLVDRMATRCRAAESVLDGRFASRACGLLFSYSQRRIELR
jgi:hypothetical protein